MVCRRMTGGVPSGLLLAAGGLACLSSASEVCRLVDYQQRAPDATLPAPTIAHGRVAQGPSGAVLVAVSGSTCALCSSTDVPWV